MIETPFASIDQWLGYFKQAELPVLRHTAKELDALRDNAESVNARVLASIILQDPLMTLRLLAHIEAHRRSSQNADITTIERALIMIGIQPFFHHFENLPTVEDSLNKHPRALLGLLKVIARARRATHWAREWALLRHDLDVDEITVATLLHDFAEIMMWSFAPSLALRVRDLQNRDRNLRSTAAQQTVYNVTLDQLKLSLAQVWRLPPLLTTLMDRANADHPRVRNVTLAVDLARHSANGWDDAALPDDYKGIGELLHLSHEAVLQKLGVENNSLPTVTDNPQI